MFGDSLGTVKSHQQYWCKPSFIWLHKAESASTRICVLFDEGERVHCKQWLTDIGHSESKPECWWICRSVVPPIVVERAHMRGRFRLGSTGKWCAPFQPAGFEVHLEVQITPTFLIFVMTASAADHPQPLEASATGASGWVVEATWGSRPSPTAAASGGGRRNPGARSQLICRVFRRL